MVLRTIHELFEADTVNALASIILNGWVSSLDKQNPQSARRNNFPDGHISWWFLLLSENLSASNYPGAATSAASNALASCKSAVSKPSVNQP
jgi:hypothetical protein